MNKKSLYAILTASTVVILGLVWGLVFVVSNTGQSNSNSNPNNVFQSERTLTGKTADQDRADVFNAALELLRATNAPDDYKDYTSLLISLDGKTSESIPLAFLDRVRFIAPLDSDTSKIATYQAMLTFAMLSKSASENNEIGSAFANASDAVFVDQKAGLAYVPMSVFVNQDTATNTFNIEFVYVDNKWYLQPFSILEQLKMSMIFQAQIEENNKK